MQTFYYTKLLNNEKTKKPIGCFTFRRGKVELHKPTLNWGGVLYSVFGYFQENLAPLVSTLIYKYLIEIGELFSHMQSCSLKCSNAWLFLQQQFCFTALFETTLTKAHFL